MPLPSDLEIIAAVNELARGYVNPSEEKMLPEGTRVDMHRWRWARRYWEQAVKEYKEKTGYDAIEALARHEAKLRSRENAPQLYIERR